MRDFTVHSMACTPIPLGNMGENAGDKIIFPIDTWLGNIDASTGSFTLVVKRVNDTTPYPVSVTHDQENVYWVVSSTDLEQEGFGQCELTYTLGTSLTKTVTFVTRTYASLSGSQSSVTPTPAQSWVDQVITQTGANASSASASATAAATSASQAAASANNAVKVTSQSFSTQQKQIARENIGANDASNITTGMLAIANGGTGATTAAGARTALGVIAIGGNAGGLAGGTYTSLAGQSRGNSISGGYYRFGDFIFVNVFITAGSEWAENKSWTLVYGLPTPAGAIQSLPAYIFNDSEVTDDLTVTASIFERNDHSAGDINVRAKGGNILISRRINISGLYYSPQA